MLFSFCFEMVSLCNQLLRCVGYSREFALVGNAPHLSRAMAAQESPNSCCCTSLPELFRAQLKFQWEASLP